ncbi:hypothetical protein PENSPDRAFT_666027 [Peniophora sp. CONT]|nr:hypothetical protein PENSPDRAFT_666027 [Peniophora sp. CONT]
MHSFDILVSAFLGATFVCGQDFNVPANWRKPSSSRLRSERLSIAQTAIESLVPAINTSDGTSQGMDVWASANVPASLAQHDYISGTQDNREVVLTSVTAFRNTHPAFFDKTQMWGLAAFYGARAYNDSGLLELAEGVWNVATVYTVTAQDGASGTQHTRNAAQMPNSLGCNGETIGAYVALSAHLWESTDNLTYLNAAEQSASFANTHMYIQFYQIIMDTYDLGSCSSSDMAWTYNQGFFLEGLSILSSAPVSNKTTWISLLQTMVVSTVQFSVWTASNGSNVGVLIENDSNDPTKFQEAWVFRNAFTRGLYEVWSRLNSSSPMANLIQAFMMVQYNALLDLASNNGSFYSPKWSGPQLVTKVPWGQLSAMEVLNAAIGMAPANSSTTSSATAAPVASATTATQSATTSATSRSISDGAIAGLVVGVVGGLAVAAAGIWLVVRHKHRAETDRSPRLGGPGSGMREVDPFPPGILVTQPREEMVPVTGYVSKDRHGYGLGSPLSVESSRPTALDSTEPPSTTAADYPVAREPDNALETALTRAIQQVVDRMQANEAPPSYTGQ